MRDVAQLLAGLHAVGAADAVRTLAARAVEAVDVEDPDDVAELLGRCARSVPMRRSGRCWPAIPAAASVSIAPERR